MKKILAALFNPWLLLVLGLAALALVVWVIGPLLAIANWRPLESVAARWVCIGVIVALVMLRKLWQAWRARATNAKVVDQLLVQAAPDGAAGPADAELKLLGERFAQALETLRTARFDQGKTGVAAAWAGLSARLGKRYLYELPWYAIIGAPGSGKTTALMNSGLEFPLADRLGEPAVRGVGGTRNCDWWFTNQAVLIDTAGRYTTHDSDQAADSKAWEGFLGLLKRSRPRQPLNGVLVTVSVSDLLTRSAEQRAQHGAAVRRRVQELHRHLALRFPIYLLVTKCDLLAGFVDYLGDIDKDTRASPWGFTFALDTQQRVDLAQFGAEFDALEQRLTNGLIQRLQLERDPARRARIYAFPQQFEALRGLLHEFIAQVFSASQFEAHPLLRGVYFVSGTQEGTPIDRLLGRIARAYRLERTVLPAHEGSGKSYFLTRLLSDVIFAESALAGTDAQWERRRGWLAGLAYAGLAVLGLGALGAWSVSTLKNRAYVARVDAAATSARVLLQATPNHPTVDLPALLPTFEATRDLARAGIGDSAPWSMGFGLYQGRKLDAASQHAYRRMLVDALLPRLALRVEDQLKSGADNAELQYEALKTYVMLYDPAHFDRKALALYVRADWKTSLPRSVTTEQRGTLESHLDALLADGPTVSPLAEDKALVAQVRARLAAVPLPERVYRRLKLQGIGDEIPEFTVAQAAGPAAALVFTRANNAPLTQGVPGLFTYDGYHKGFQREVERVTQQLADEEGWVLGVNDPSRRARLREADARRYLADLVRRLYLEEYAQTWEDFIKGVKVLPMNSLARAAEMARVLSEPNNPLVPLLKAMSHQTTLIDSTSVAAQVISKAGDLIQRPRAELDKLFGVTTAVAPLPPGTRIESIVDDRFVTLRQQVTSADGKAPAPIETTLALIREKQAQLLAAEEDRKRGNPTPPPPPGPNPLDVAAANAPEPARSILSKLSAAGKVLDFEANRETLNREISAQIGVFCRQAVAGRYPFVRTSARDVTREDFARLFAPGGLFDSFFQQKLMPLVDSSARPWRFKPQGNATLGSPSGALLQFQHAAILRETFFPGGGNVPSLRLDFKPLEMDTSITQFILDVDGQVVKYAHGPQIPAQVQWPGPGGSKQVRVALSPVTSGTSGLVTDGPWALFKLFDRLQIEPSGAPERFRATFNIEGRRAVFDVTASSVRNPFRLPELEAFSCPDKL